jgi:phosphatidylserine/phosphatidylglycerophosphate/cardiolipin synthase-like enzyme
MPMSIRSASRVRSSFRPFVGLALAAAACVPAATGCSVTTNENASDSTEAVTLTGGAQSSYVSDAVLGVLNQSPAMKGVTWNVSHDNTFDANWLVNTPLQPLWGKSVSTLSYPATTCSGNCDADFGLQLCSTQADCTGGGTCTPVQASVNKAGGTPKMMCVGHSDAFVDEIYGLITSAQKFVDVTSLLPADGRYAAAIRNAITVLSARPTPPEVRIITGDFPVEGVVNTTTQLKSFTRDVPSSSNIRVAVGAFRSSDTSFSWNHAKIIAVDGQTALVGGHNMWTQQYLMLDPVNDVSMVVHGSAAGDAHRFANQLWNYTCNNMTWNTYLTWSVWENQFENGSITSHCPAAYNLPTVAGPSNGTVISVGRLGTGITSNANQADDARLALINAAKTTIRITQQDIGPTTVPYLGMPTGSWPTDELAALANALVRGVDVYIILSDLNATAGALSATAAGYSNGWTPQDVGNHIKSYMQSTSGYPTGTALDALLCSKLHLTAFRYGQDETWPDGTHFASHAKQIAIDGQAIYIASHNMYPANLQEFGYIVDDSRVTADWIAKYWNNAWTNSSRVAVSGPEAAQCLL